MAKRKRTFLEKINPFDKESRGRRAGKKAAKATKGMVGFGYGVPSKGVDKKKAAQDKKQAKRDVYKKTTSVHPISRHHTKKAVVEKTKGGDYPVYKKKSKTAKSFGSAFKSNCAGKGAGDSFSWQGRSYSCARASDKPAATKKKAVSKSAATKKPAATKKLSYFEKHKQTIKKYKQQRLQRQKK